MKQLGWTFESATQGRLEHVGRGCGPHIGSSPGKKNEWNQSTIPQKVEPKSFGRKFFPALVVMAEFSEREKYGMPKEYL